MEEIVMIAYCLLVHKNPDQVSRLISRIYTPEDRYYINVFNSNSTVARNSWRDAFRTFPKDNVVISFVYEDSYGTFELVDATLNAMKYFTDYDYQYFINLSGQDYPLKSVDAIKKILKEDKVSYIDYYTMPSYRE